jgi:hypothetical protein
MNVWVWIATCIVCAGLAAQTLDVKLKLRLAFALAHWSALMLIGLRVAAYAFGQATA